VTFLIQLLIVVALDLISYAITPHPKAPSSPVQDAQAPMASAGMTIPVPFGEIEVLAPDTLWWGDKAVNQYTIDT